MSEYPARLTINVTAEDIARGEPGVGWACPVALAVRREHPEWSAQEVSVGNAYLSVDPRRGGPPHPEAEVAYRMTQRAARFVADFDAGYEVQPQTFILRMSAT